jgi:hypothetical protein
LILAFREAPIDDSTSKTDNPKTAYCLLPTFISILADPEAEPVEWTAFVQ